ncbi:tRNA pseudouridine(55) synthase TruB [soil metagenome]
MASTRTSRATAERVRLDGLAVIDKPAGWTSHDVVAKARGVLGTRKIGHAGTLDPDATGVLLLGVGRVTRLLRFLTALPKRYEGEIVLGTETSTLDAAGVVTATHDMAGVTLAEVRAAAVRFVGAIEQIPPMVSAVKVGGRRLHELARAGEEVDRAPRPVTVHRFEVDDPVADVGPGVFGVLVECSSGTYVRTLAADVGRALGGGAHLRALRRTAIGSFTLAEAHPVEAAAVLTPAEALRDYPGVVVADEVAAAVGYGKVLPGEVLGAAGEGPWPVLDAAGDLLAVYQAHRDGTFKPAVVIRPAGG